MADINIENGVQYLQFQSVVDHSFWHKLCQLKLDVDKLEETERLIWGSYLQSEVTSVSVGYESFNRHVDWKLYSSQFTTLEGLCSPDSKCNFSLVAMRGLMRNFNTSEGFKNCDKKEVLLSQGLKIKDDITSGRAINDPSLITSFILLTYADLKKYDFFYWFAFPASLSFQASYVGQQDTLQNLIPQSQLKELFKSHKLLSKEQRTVFGVILETDSKPRCVPLQEYISLINNGEDSRAYLCYLDPSTDRRYPGWPLRNILALISFHWKDAERTPVKIISFRIGSNFYQSPVFQVLIKVTDGEMMKWVGWEKNARDKLGARFTSLKDTMDPSRLADTSAELNLKLMKWRLAPALDLDVIAKQRVLILGAGTLGCALARNLLCWGVRNLTFVDYGCVSYSNPVRQCLYTHSDCLKEKAEAAAASLKQILPSVNSHGVKLEIPMPGHSTASVTSANILHDLINDHDAVFLVTDSRESRWLPTLISASLGKICITAALGFNTYLVMRHGLRSGGGDGCSQLGCYFCNDVTAPGDSSADRTLDEQCTVSRPGVSNIAASLASELFVSMLQPVNKPTGTSDSLAGCSKNRKDNECSLGLIPHSIRGFLSTYNHLLLATTAFSKCIACSPTVIHLYNNDREMFLTKVFESNSYLEDVTGLSELRKLTEDIEDLSMSDEEKD